MRGAVPQHTEDGLWLAAPTTESGSRVQGWGEWAARPSLGTGRKAATARGQSERGRKQMQHSGQDLPPPPWPSPWCPALLSKGALVPALPALLWGMEGCAASPASPLRLSAESSPFPEPASPPASRDGSTPRPPGPHGAATAQRCPQWVCAADPDPHARPLAQYTGWGCSAWEEDCLSWGTGDPSMHRQVPPGWDCPACPAQPWPSVCSIRIRLCQDPFRWQRPVGPGSPALPRALQMGHPPLTCCLASGSGPSSWLRASAACGTNITAARSGAHAAPGTTPGTAPGTTSWGACPCPHSSAPCSGRGAAGASLPGLAAKLPLERGPPHSTLEGIVKVQHCSAWGRWAAMAPSHAMAPQSGQQVPIMPAGARTGEEQGWEGCRAATILRSVAPLYSPSTPPCPCPCPKLVPSPVSPVLL